MPEFARMSNGGRGKRGGIGASWFAKFGASDVAPSGQVVVNGHLANAPRYYMKLLERSDPAQYLRVMEERRALGERAFGESAPKRLEDREAVAQARVKMLKRTI